jgi:phosphoribosylaminoimidazole-succinocarboxamide synthase
MVGGRTERFDLDGRFGRIDDVKVERGVDLDGEVVPRDRVSTPDLRDDGARVYVHDAHDAHEEDKAGGRGPN